jgi:receptor kinase-like protein
LAHKKKTGKSPNNILARAPDDLIFAVSKSNRRFLNKQSNLLGSGSFGFVYKGELQAGETINHVAVKVLKLQTPSALKSFTAECVALRNLRHRNSTPSFTAECVALRNLVKIITICSSIDARGNDFKAIVYDFMLNGNLEILHPAINDHTEQRFLNLLQSYHTT